MVNRASLKADMSSIFPKNGRFIYSVLFPQIIDIDGCIRNPCHANVTCNNAKRYYIHVCVYDSGYSGDCFNCTGIQTFNFYSRHRSHTYKLVKKKAQQRFVICSILFPCACHFGYSGDGFNCTGMQTFNFYSRYRSYTYILVKKKAQQRFVICSILFPQIVDVDECTSKPCHANATCNNTEGSYVCACHSGYSGNGVSCTGMHCMHLTLILLQKL